jgi:HEAT repeat protein
MVGLLVLAGCAQEPAPLAGGKPFDYWFNAARQPDPKARAQAIAKLGNIGAGTGGIDSVLLEATSDRDPRVRCQAILALMKLPELTARSLPIMQDLSAHDQDAQVRQYAGTALKKLSAQ